MVLVHHVFVFFARSFHFAARIPHRTLAMDGSCRLAYTLNTDERPAICSLKDIHEPLMSAMISIG